MMSGADGHLTVKESVQVSVKPFLLFYAMLVKMVLCT